MLISLLFHRQFTKFPDQVVPVIRGFHMFAKQEGKTGLWTWPYNKIMSVFTPGSSHASWGSEWTNGIPLIAWISVEWMITAWGNFSETRGAKVNTVELSTGWNNLQLSTGGYNLQTLQNDHLPQDDSETELNFVWFLNSSMIGWYHPSRTTHRHGSAGWKRIALIWSRKGRYRLIEYFALRNTSEYIPQEGWTAESVGYEYWRA
jgi:hypothetical protein